MAVENEVKSDMDALHSAVTEAYDEVVSAAGAEPETKPAADPEPTGEPAVSAPAADEPQAGETVRDPATGKFIPRKGDAKPVAKPQGAAPGTSPAGTPATKPQTPVAKPTAAPVTPDPLGRAPQSWKPQAREAYTALAQLGEAGKAIREEVHRRDREVMATLQKTAEQRTFFDEFQRTMQPFAPVMAVTGHTPLQTVQTLMQTAAALQMGPPNQKAAIAANIIRNYGVDVDMLAQALEAGGIPQAPAGQGYDPRLDQFLADQQRREAAAQQQRVQAEQHQQQELQARYEQFAQTHEFFEDVRALMATIVTVKAEQEGVDVDDEEAYTMAIALRPDLTKIIQQREELAQATKPDGSTARAAAAAVSLQPGNNMAVQKAADPNNLHSVLAEAYDEVMGKK